MTDELVRIADYDPGWPGRFAAQQSLLEDLLKSWLAGPVEHIGSTAVPGLAAKPVIDMLAPVHSLAVAQAAVPVLAAAGWLLWPQDPARHYRLWFLRPAPETRTHHLHVIAHRDPHAIALLGFRDALRADRGLRRDYAALKQQLAQRSPANRNAYSNAKGDFIGQALRQAGMDVPPRDLLPE